MIRQDAATGMRFIVAVHSTVLGPALGGLRLKRYPGGLREALADVMGLARTMTLKASAAGLALGGGKAVMIDDGLADTRDARLDPAAGVIDELGGAYITAEDIGTTTADMDLMSRHTPYVVGRSLERGGGGDPSPVTAETVFQAMRCGLGAATGSDELDDRRVGVVGWARSATRWPRELAGAGADVVACDLDEARGRALRGRARRRGRALGRGGARPCELDVIAPCAAGGMIDDALARAIDCRVVAGAANNPLTEPRGGRARSPRRGHPLRARLPRQLRRPHPRGRRVVRPGRARRGRAGGAREECLERAIATAEAEGSTPLEVAERQALERVERRPRVSVAAVPLGERPYTRAGLQSDFEPVATRRTFEEAVEQIAEKVKAGDLHVGDRLPSERELAARMRISRPTLREAVKVLAEAGVLEVRRGQAGGIFVAAELVPRELLRSRQEIRVSEVAGVLEARRLLEPRVAQLAAVHASEDDFAVMAALIERKRELARRDDVLRHEDLFLQLDLKFHLAMARATRNSTVVSLMRSLFKRLEIARDMAVHAPPVPDWVIDVHERTLAAIRSADFPAIEEVMDEHLAQLEQIWEQETGRGLVRPLPDFLQPVAERSRALRDARASVPAVTAPLLVVDAPSMLFRAFYALPDSITGKDDQPVNALLGTANLVLREVEEHSPRAVVLCFGPDAAEYRVELYDGYHAERPEVPDGLAPQFADSRDFFEAFGWTVAWHDSLEADDLLGSYARLEAEAGGRVLVMTGDRDMFQCATDQVTVLYVRTGGRGRRAGGPGRGAQALRRRRRSRCPTSSRCAATPRTASPARAGSARRRRPSCSSATARSRPRWTAPCASRSRACAPRCSTSATSCCASRTSRRCATPG